MKRKLVKQGYSALTMTIPTGWAKLNNLHAGDEVEVEDLQDALAISVNKKQHSHHIKIDVSGLPPRLADRFISRAYQKGYDKVTVQFDSPEIMSAIKDKVSELMGFEILNISKNSMDIQVISSELEFDFDILLRKTFLILQEMGETCRDSWKKGDKKALKNLMARDIDVNKFLYFCQRYLNRSPKSMSFGGSMLYHQLESLEKLGDELKRLGSLLAQMPVDKDILEIITTFNQLLRISVGFFYSPKKEKAAESFILFNKIRHLIDAKFSKTTSREASMALVALYSTLTIVFHLTSMRLDTLSEMEQK